MKSELKELMGIIVIKAIVKLFQWNVDGKVTWCHIAENRNGEESCLEDFEKVDEALSEDNFHGSFSINLFRDGTALVGWNINGDHHDERGNR